jgi:predicted amino acid dehydrogenase
VPAQATAAVVGATGAIGRVCALKLAGQVARLILIGRRPEPLAQVQAQAQQHGPAQVLTSTTMSALPQADIVLTVTNAIDAVIKPHHLKSGAVVCDVARPRDVSSQVVEARDDVLVIEGGMVKVPGPVNFNFDFGFPPGMAFACMAETITLALDGLYTCYTLGKDISLEQVNTIHTLAAKHGFHVSGFRSFELALPDEKIDQIKRNAYQRQARLKWANS